MSRSSWSALDTTEDVVGYANLRPRKIGNRRIKPCNICGACYTPRSRFDRFCLACRSDDELYRYAEWAGAN